MTLKGKAAIRATSTILFMTKISFRMGELLLDDSPYGNQFASHFGVERYRLSYAGDTARICFGSGAEPLQAKHTSTPSVTKPVPFIDFSS